MWSGSAPVCQRKLSSINFVFVCIYSHAVICSDLPPLPNGAISYNGGSTDNRPINTIATHSCNTGYTHTGDSVRLCQNDRTWSGSTPTCQGEDNQNSPATEYSISLLTVFCGPPPSITNGSPGQPTSTMIGGEVTYTCDTGFILTGSETITCFSTGKWSSSPSCQSKYINHYLYRIFAIVCYGRNFHNYCRASYEK